MKPRLLIDNSAWARLGHADLPEPRTEEIAAAFEAGEVAVCLPFLLEAGYSARSGPDHARLFEELLSLPYMVIEQGVERRALDAQGQLARAGHHRVPPVDLLIAALAENDGLDLLHYDADYELIAERTDLRFHSLWLAERGTL